MTPVKRWVAISSHEPRNTVFQVTAPDSRTGESCLSRAAVGVIGVYGQNRRGLITPIRAILYHEQDAGRVNTEVDGVQVLGINLIPTTRALPEGGEISLKPDGSVRSRQHRGVAWSLRGVVKP